MRSSWLIMLLVVLGCGPEVGYESLESDAEQFCADLVVCEELPDPARYAAKCENEILDEGEVARDEGGACARSFEALVHCLADLSCDEYRDWGYNHANTNSSTNSSGAYPCKKQTEKFLDECAKTWFAPNVRR